MATKVKRMNIKYQFFVPCVLTSAATTATASEENEKEKNGDYILRDPESAQVKSIVIAPVIPSC